MKSPLFFTIIFCLGFYVWAQTPTSPQYLLDVSGAYNHLQRKDYAQAGALINQYLNLGSQFADAHLIMGEILIQRKLYQQAERYLTEAEKGREHFIFPEQVIRLYWDQMKIFSRSQNMYQLMLLDNDDEDSDTIFSNSSLPLEVNIEANMEKINRSLQNIINYASSRPGEFYREHAARAYFMIGRFSLFKDHLKGIQSFLGSIERGFLVRSSYLYLAYFFAIHSQEVIDNVYQDSPQGPPKKRKGFLLYYQNHLQTQEDEDLRQDLVPQPEYAAMEYATQLYYKSLQK